MGMDCLKCEICDRAGMDAIDCCDACRKIVCDRGDCAVLNANGDLYCKDCLDKFESNRLIENQKGIHDYEQNGDTN